MVGKENEDLKKEGEAKKKNEVDGDPLAGLGVKAVNAEHWKRPARGAGGGAGGDPLGVGS